jgi:homogentisate 1,2-dioxygenase
MPFYHRLGDVPQKRHTVSRKPGGGLLSEELVGNKGFVGPASLLYHLHRPTEISSLQRLRDAAWEVDRPLALKHRHFFAHRLPNGPSATLDRSPLMGNRDVLLALAQPSSTDGFFYRNAQADECLYVTEGSGVLESAFGELNYRAGDYLVIPRGILYRLRLHSIAHKILVIESRGYLRTPKRYRNEHGQLTEMAPYSERDFRRPERLAPIDKEGEYRIVVKQHDAFHEVVVKYHPFDVVAWDGYYYPFALSIHDFEPRVGRFHLPPPVHQTFEGDGFVVCSFCPRPYDFDPNAIPAPYNHSNVMSDEVLYYANSEFMSRKGIEYGSVTLHPDGIPHGPHPGKVEASIGKKATGELAVMVDTFEPLQVAKAAVQAEDDAYWQSWQEGRH